MKHSKLMINSAIEALIQSKSPDIESASEIIAYSETIPFSDTKSMYKYSCIEKKDDVIEGHTDKGDVSISDNSKEEKEEFIGLEHDRIGYYRMWKYSVGLIFFQHWKAFMDQGNLFPEDKYVKYKEYFLLYNEDDHQNIVFGYNELEKISFFEYYKNYFFNESSLFKFSYIANNKKEVRRYRMNEIVIWET